MKHLILSAALILALTHSLFANNEYRKQIVAACIVLEAGGEGKIGMQAVANVLVNRANRRNTDLYTEARRKWQFSCMNGRSDSEVLRLANAKRFENSFSYALTLLEVADTGHLQDVSGGATHYHNTKVLPGWAWKLKRVKQIGNHIFYKE